MKMAAKTGRDIGRREAPRGVIIAAVVALVLVVGAGGYYAINGGWQTAAQQDEAYKHELLPIVAAKHGNPEALEAENRLRSREGRPALQIPKDKKQTSPNDPAKLADLQRRMGARQADQSQP
jgi:hypothetical protein